MKVLLYHPPFADNPNDQLIVDGVRFLISQTGDHEMVSVKYGQNLPEGDCLVVCGTPWIFLDCGSSWKINELERILKRFTGRKIAVGIGACFPLGLTEPFGMDRGVSVWKGFDAVSVRDNLAHSVLTSQNVSCDRHICPVVFAPRVRAKAGQSNLYVHTYSTPANCLPDRDKTDRVIGLTQADVDSAFRYGFKQVRLVTDLDELKREIEVSRAIYSGRVHSCVYALGKVKSIVPLQTDSRMETFLEIMDLQAEKRMMIEWIRKALQ